MILELNKRYKVIYTDTRLRNDCIQKYTAAGKCLGCRLHNDGRFSMNFKDDYDLVIDINFDTILSLKHIPKPDTEISLQLAQLNESIMNEIYDLDSWKTL